MKESSLFAVNSNHRHSVHFFDPVWAPAHSVSLVCKTSPNLGTDWACDYKIKKYMSCTEFLRHRQLNVWPVDNFSIFTAIFYLMTHSHKNTNTKL